MLNRTITTILRNGVSSALPKLTFPGPAISPDGRFVWARVANLEGTLLRLDLSTDPPIATDVSIPALSSELFGNMYVLRTPAPPASFVWMATEETVTGIATIGSIDSAGTWSPLVTFPDTSRNFVPAQDTERLCIAWTDGAEAHLRWYSHTAAPEVLLDLPTNATFSGVATTVNAAGDEACWIFLSSGGDLRFVAVDPGGVAVDETFSGFPTFSSITVRSLEEIWIVFDDVSGGVRVHLRDEGAAWSRTNRPAPFDSSLIAPFGQ